MPFFNVAGGDQLACQQRIEDADQIDAEIVLDKFRVELCIVGNLDRTWGAEKLSQGRERITPFQIRINKTIEVDDEDPIGTSQLDQTQAREVRIEISRLSIETDYLCL